jgi:hypothetical protein
MIRAIYRWRVKPGEEEKFIRAWTQGTGAIRAQVKGAGGSLLMRRRHDLSEFMALAYWNSIEDWQAFAAESDSALPDPRGVSGYGCCERAPLYGDPGGGRGPAGLWSVSWHTCCIVHRLERSGPAPRTGQVLNT